VAGRRVAMTVHGEGGITLLVCGRVYRRLRYRSQQLSVVDIGNNRERAPAARLSPPPSWLAVSLLARYKYLCSAQPHRRPRLGE